MKKAVVSVPAPVKLRWKSAISHGNSEGMTRWKKCEVAWAKPTSDITRRSPARAVAADASISRAAEVVLAAPAAVKRGELRSGQGRSRRTGLDMELARAMGARHGT